MSERNGSSAWVGDLDRCVGYGFDLPNARGFDRELREFELDEVGDLQLLDGKAISARQLNKKSISPSEWRLAVHQSEMTIGFDSTAVFQALGQGTDSPLTRFVKGMLDLGRPYAIARYARWERLDYPSALTATLPYGIRALVINPAIK
jgi:hypothetical protein